MESDLRREVRVPIGELRRICKALERLRDRDMIVRTLWLQLAGLVQRLEKEQLQGVKQ